MHLNGIGFKGAAGSLVVVLSLVVGMSAGAVAAPTARGLAVDAGGDVTIDDMIEGMTDAQLGDIQAYLSADAATQAVNDGSCGNSCFSVMTTAYSVNGGTSAAGPYFTCVWWKEPSSYTTPKFQAANALVSYNHAASYCGLSTKVAAGLPADQKLVKTKVDWTVDMTKQVASLDSPDYTTLQGVYYKLVKLVPENEALPVCTKELALQLIANPTGWSKDPDMIGILKGSYEITWDLSVTSNGKKSKRQMQIYPAVVYFNGAEPTINCAGGGVIETYYTDQF